MVLVVLDPLESPRSNPTPHKHIIFFFFNLDGRAIRNGLVFFFF